MARNGLPGELSPPKRRAILALLAERDVRAAAKAASVAERSLHRWLSDSAFRAALLEAEGDAIDQATRRLIGLQDGAIDTLAGVLKDAGTPAAVRLRAAQSILDYLLKLRELRNLEQRLADLEAAVYDNPDKKN